jgi:EAL domain-containing protein (putative c-di-GMP-specific phosphodiesterase class I)
LSVVAEGIETQAQFDLLRDLGCESAQGYWIAKPMPSDQLPNWCRTWSEGKTWPQSQVAAG